MVAMVLSSLGKGIRRYTPLGFFSIFFDMGLNGEGITSPAQWISDFFVHMLKEYLKRKEGIMTIFKWQCVQARELFILKLQWRF